MMLNEVTGFSKVVSEPAGLYDLTDLTFLLVYVHAFHLSCQKYARYYMHCISS